MRIDTYKDNKVMRRLIEKHGFQYCSTIRIAARPDFSEQDTERLAFQWTREDLRRAGVSVNHTASAEDTAVRLN
ncbi:MAG: hypothetical protein ACTTKL_06305 [Treponema sp.]